MKMAKKLLAVVLTGVMAMSVLTGCASIETRQIANKLEGILKGVNTEATVSATKSADDLADKVKSAIVNSNTTWSDPTAVLDGGAASAKKTVDEAVKAALKDTTDKKDTYVWYTYFATKNVNKEKQAKAIADLVKETSKAVNGTEGAINNIKVTEGKTENTYKPTTGNKYELGMATFTHNDSNGKKVDYVAVVVTCKAVASSEKVS